MADDVYPRGKDFPFILYDVRSAAAGTTPVTRADLAQIRSLGAYSVVHTYRGSQFAEVAEWAHIEDLRSLYSLYHGYDQTGAAGANAGPHADLGRSYIEDVASNTSISYWDLPEEVPPAASEGWKQTLLDYIAEVRSADPLQRPSYFYGSQYWGLPDYRDRVWPYDMDIIAISAYAAYHHNESGFQQWYPNAWVRYRVESVINAATDAGKTIGRRYLAGEKTVFAVIECFYGRAGQSGDVPTVASTKHNLWQALVSGAKGVAIYSHWHRFDHATLGAVFNALTDAGKLLRGPEGVGQAILFGRVVTGMVATITAGPTLTERFLPNLDDPQQFGSIDFRAILYRDHMYLIVVNSQETASVTVEIGTLPAGVTSGRDLLTGTNYTASSGRFSLTLPGLGVAVLKCRRVGRYDYRFIIIVPAAALPDAELFATIDFEGECGEEHSFPIPLGPSAGGVTHYACDIAATSEMATAIKERAADLGSFWYQFDNQGLADLQETNSTTAQASVGSSGWTLARAISDRSLVRK